LTETILKALSLSQDKAEELSDNAMSSYPRGGVKKK
jgi:hypothetical protein